MGKFTQIEKKDIEVKKTVKEVKEEEKNRLDYAKILYGAGSDGWTKEWYETILEAYKDNRLTIGEIRPFDERVVYKKELPNYYGEMNVLLSENKKEEDLTDEERVFIFAYAHPYRKLVIKLPTPGKTV